MRAGWFTLAAALLAATSAAYADSVSLKDSVPHITTTGTASTEIVPDRAVIHLNVSNERPDGDAASQATAKAAGAIMAAVESQGVAAKDIETSLELTAQYDPVTDGRGRVVGSKLRGYQAKEGITVHVHDVSKVGAIARDVVRKGATGIDGIDFRFSKRKEAMRELNAAAMRDAMAEANSYVEAVGAKLGRLLQVGEDSEDGNEVELPSRRAAPASVDASTQVANFPIEPGTRMLKQSVTATWEIDNTRP